MKEDILMTIWYLSLVLLGLPTIYFLSSSGSESVENKKKALKVYPASLFLVLLITVLIYGVQDTKKVVGQAFGDFVFFTFYTVIGIVLIIILIVFVLYLLNLEFVFESLKKSFKKNRFLIKIFEKFKKLN